MLRKELIISIFAAFILLGAFGTALAEINSYEEESQSLTAMSEMDGSTQSFEQPERIDLEGSEGSYESEYEIGSTPKAHQAAASYDYLSAGNTDYRDDDYGTWENEVIVDRRGAVCSNC